MQNNMFEEKEMGVVTSGAEKIPQADMDKTVGKAFYSVEEIAVLMGISRSKAYIFKIINGVFFTFFDFYT